MISSTQINIQTYRAYRLVLIIANEWFEYYWEWRNQKERFNWKAFLQTSEAYDIWNSGKGIEEFRFKDGWKAWKVFSSK